MYNMFLLIFFKKNNYFPPKKGENAMYLKSNAFELIFFLLIHIFFSKFCTIFSVLLKLEVHRMPFCSYIKQVFFYKILSFCA